MQYEEEKEDMIKLLRERVMVGLIPSKTPKFLDPLKACSRANSILKIDPIKKLINLHG